MARSASAAATPPHGVTGGWMDVSGGLPFFCPKKMGRFFWGGQVGRFLICFFFSGGWEKKRKGLKVESTPRKIH